MFKAASILAITILTAGLNGSAFAQSQTQADLRTDSEAIDGRLRADARKRIQEQIEQDEARGKERAAEQRRRSGVSEEAPVAEASPPAAEAAPVVAAGPPPKAVPPVVEAATPPPGKKADGAAPVRPSKAPQRY